MLAILVMLAACGGSDAEGSADPVVGSTITEAGDAGEAVEGSAPLAVAVAGFEGIEVYDGLTREHVDAPNYDLSPPPGGDHLGQWAPCRFYDEPVPDGNMVHSLEHGAVWIAYDPVLDDASVAAIAAAVDGDPYVAASPYPGVDSPVVMVAWGLRLRLDAVDDARFGAFVDEFAQGPQTPEPGVAC